MSGLILFRRDVRLSERVFYLHELNWGMERFLKTPQTRPDGRDAIRLWAGTKWG